MMWRMLKAEFEYNRLEIVASYAILLAVLILFAFKSAAAHGDEVDRNFFTVSQFVQMPVLFTMYLIFMKNGKERRNRFIRMLPLSPMASVLSRILFGATLVGGGAALSALCVAGLFSPGTKIEAVGFAAYFCGVMLTYYATTTIVFDVRQSAANSRMRAMSRVLIGALALIFLLLWVFPQVIEFVLPAIGLDDQAAALESMVGDALFPFSVFLVSLVLLGASVFTYMLRRSYLDT